MNGAVGGDGGLVVVAAPGADAEALLGALGADDVRRPPEAPTDAGWGWSWEPVLDAWRDELAATPRPGRAVVCTWPAAPTVGAVVDLTPEQWRAGVEWPTALWFTTAVALAEHCADGASLVVVVERPATLDAVGHGASVAVGDGLANLVRSLAAAHGDRGVRVNAVATELRTAPDALMGAPPRLASFPGTVEGEVAGAVRMLLSPDASGVTATTVAADCGRR